MMRIPGERTPRRAGPSVVILLFLCAPLFGCSYLGFPPEESRKGPPEAKVEAKQPPPEVIPPEPPKPEQQQVERGKGKPYQVRGKTYYPLLSAHGYEERGIASWYGPSFHGRKTSCGETFDMHKISAAHKLLPMHTKIEVTNLENGRSTILTVNDRGPFIPGRVLDLSYAAAKDLGMVEKGLARVLIRTSGKVQGQKDKDMIGEFYVHIGSFKEESDAHYLLRDMMALKYKPSTIKVIRSDRDGEVCWRVEQGPFKSMSAANKAHAKTVKDYPSAFVVADEQARSASNR